METLQPIRYIFFKFSAKNLLSLTAHKHESGELFYFQKRQRDFRNEQQIVNL